MAFLYVFVVVVFFALGTNFFVSMWRGQGTFGVVKLCLVLVGVLSGVMWMFGPSLNDGVVQIPAADTLQALPWGTIWVVDTLVIAALYLMHQRQSLRSAGSASVK